MDVSCHMPFLSGTPLEPAVIPTAQSSSFTLQYVPYYVWCSKYICLFLVNLSNVFLVQFPNFSLSFSLLFQWLKLLLVQSYISGSTFVASLYIISCILTSFPLPFELYYYYYYYNRIPFIRINWVVSHPDMQKTRIYLWKQATLAVWSSAVTVYSLCLILNVSTSPDLTFYKP